MAKTPYSIAIRDTAKQFNISLQTVYNLIKKPTTVRHYEAIKYFIERVKFHENNIILDSGLNEDLKSIMKKYNKI